MAGGKGFFAQGGKDSDWAFLGGAAVDAGEVGSPLTSEGAGVADTCGEKLPYGGWGELVGGPTSGFKSGSTAVLAVVFEGGSANGSLDGFTGGSAVRFSREFLIESGRVCEGEGVDAPKGGFSGVPLNGLTVGFEGELLDGPEGETPDCSDVELLDGIEGEPLDGGWDELTNWFDGENPDRFEGESPGCCEESFAGGPVGELTIRLVGEFVEASEGEFLNWFGRGFRDGSLGRLTNVSSGTLLNGSGLGLSDGP